MKKLLNIVTIAVLLLTLFPSSTLASELPEVSVQNENALLFQLPSVDEDLPIFGLSLPLSCSDCDTINTSIEVVIYEKLEDTNDITFLRQVDRLQAYTKNIKQSNFYNLYFKNPEDSTIWSRRSLILSANKTYYAQIITKSPVIFFPQSLEAESVNISLFQSNFITTGQVAAIDSEKWNVTESGITFVDLEKKVEEDFTIKAFQVYSLTNDNQIKLKIWDKNNGGWDSKESSATFTASEGFNEFTVEPGLDVSTGQYLGLFTSKGNLARLTTEANQGKDYVFSDTDSLGSNKITHDNLGHYSFAVKSLNENDYQATNIYQDSNIFLIDKPVFAGQAGITISDEQKPFSDISLWLLIVVYAAIVISFLTFLYFGKKIWSEKKFRTAFIIMILTSIVCASFYFIFVSTDFLGGDNYSYMNAEAYHGDVHFHGHPLTVNLGYLFQQAVPWGNFMYKANLFASFLVSLGLGLLAGAIYLLTKRKIFSYLFPMALGTSFLTWNIAVMAESYSMVFFTLSLLIFSFSYLHKYPSYKAFFLFSITVFLAPVGHMMSAIGALGIGIIGLFYFWQQAKLSILKLIPITLAITFLFSIIYIPLALTSDPQNFPPIFTFTHEDKIIEYQSFQWGDKIDVDQDSLKYFLQYISGNDPAKNRRSFMTEIVKNQGVVNLYRKQLPTYFTVLLAFTHWLLITLGGIGLIFLFKYKHKTVMPWLLGWGLAGNAMLMCAEFIFYHGIFTGYIYNFSFVAFHQIPSVIYICFSIIGWHYFLKNTKDNKISKLMYFGLIVILATITILNFIAFKDKLNLRNQNEYENLATEIRTEIIPGTMLIVHKYEYEAIGVYASNLKALRNDFMYDIHSNKLDTTTIETKKSIYLPAIIDVRNRSDENAAPYIIDPKMGQNYHFVPLEVKTSIKLLWGFIGEIMNYPQYNKPRDIYYLLPQDTADLLQDHSDTTITAKNFSRYESLFVNNWKSTRRGISPIDSHIAGNLYLPSNSTETIRLEFNLTPLLIKSEAEKIDLAFYLNNQLIAVEPLNKNRQTISLTLPTKNLKPENFLSIAALFDSQNGQIIQESSYQINSLRISYQ